MKSDDDFMVTGAGDIAPAVRESLPTGGTCKEILTGTFAALVAVMVVAVLFISTEYRENLGRLPGPVARRATAAESTANSGAVLVAATVRNHNPRAEP